MKTIINESLNVKKEELNIPIMYYKFNPNRTPANSPSQLLSRIEAS